MLRRPLEKRDVVFGTEASKAFLIISQFRALRFFDFDEAPYFTLGI